MTVACPICGKPAADANAIAQHVRDSHERGRRGPYLPNARQRQQAEEVARFGPRGLSRPQPGFFAMRLVKGGVEVAACILWEPSRDPETGEVLDRPWFWSALINGEPDPNPAPEPNDRVWRCWEWGRRIDRAEYEYLIADRAWARRNAPDRPEANPEQPVDLSTLSPRALL